MYSIEDIASIISAKATIRQSEEIEQLLTDSRRIYSAPHSLFFALKGPRRNGHEHIAEAYNQGVRNFVVSEDLNISDYPDANFLKVKDGLAALQQVAAAHRSRFEIPVIGITGSNGKTIVKEWLYQLLHPDYQIVRSPRSYNSQLGVPLSVWQMNPHHTLAIFEAGISKPGEMEKLEEIIQPTIGVLTNIGAAHSEGFASDKEKEAEKRKLFRRAVEPPELNNIKSKSENGLTTITATKQDSNELISFTIPFTDAASIQNALTCCRVMLLLGYTPDIIRERMKNLAPVNMRLELKKGINNCSIINDSYSADIDSLDIALNFLDQQPPALRKTVIISDFLQTGSTGAQLYKLVAGKLAKHKVDRVIAIGEQISAASEAFAGAAFQVEYYPGTDSFLDGFISSHFKDENILIKGARIFEFERIVQQLELKAHQTVLEINLAALAHNLKQYQQVLKPGTRIMGMVKAFAYGSGGAEIANTLQFHKADYLGVAYADEGVELRKAGIKLPVMVMNPEENAFEKIISHNLEPELYSFEILEAFDRFLQEEGIQHYPVHIELETGMNRLGFSVKDIAKLGEVLKNSNSFNVRSVFTHLAASEEPAQDVFTSEQAKRYQDAASILESQLGYQFLKHIANSAAAARHPELQLDMVRLGIGLYGIDSADSHRLDLQPVATLRTTIAQLKQLHAGETVSYNRRFTANKNTLVATARIGYADGFPRRLGNGVGKVFIKDRLVPVIGTVCMDMFMVDVSEIKDVREGDDIIIFGKELPVQQLAIWAGTIPYEIMTGISQRVRRVYYEE